MTPIAFDEMEILERFGAQVVTYGWDEIELEARQAPRAGTDATVTRIRSLAGIVSSSDESLYDTACLYHALRSKVDADNLVTVCLGCYPHYAGRVCVAAALLGDDGIAASCEGDVNAGIAMRLLQYFTGAPVHFGEMLDIDRGNNTIVTSHCGCCPVSLAVGRETVVVGPVRLFGKGSAIRFPAKGGPATYANLAGRRGTYRLCAAEGEAIPVSMVFEGNPVAFRPGIPVDRLLATAHENGCGHHWMMGYGRVVRELDYFCAMTGVQGIFPGREMQ
jgi:L-arabinose isomerase